MSTDRESEPLVSSAPGEEAPAGQGAKTRGPRRRRRGSDNMLPQRDRRSWPERMLMRLIATCGIVGIGVAISAIMHSSGSEGWLIGLVVSIVSVVLSAVLWSSRML